MQTDHISVTDVEIPLTRQKNIQLSVLRLDQLHPVISGNKWFKLKYYLREAKDLGFDTLLTFGGAYSNHIAATAYAAKEQHFKAIGVIRGEEPAQWSHTLQNAAAFGMKFVFLSRSNFTAVKRDTNPERFREQFGRVYIIPEGGYGLPGVRGAKEMLNCTDIKSYTHIAAAVGTGATITGLLQASLPGQQVLGISVLKNNRSLWNEIEQLHTMPLPNRFHLFHDFHFGGYAKFDADLISFMNRFYHISNIPLDFVYTAKMMYGLIKLAEKNCFPTHSRVLSIHTGGLQGNKSFPPGVLIF